jgi:cell wall-associated NlpC family hydrolase
MCSKAIRQVCQKAHGPQMRALFGADAKESCELWRLAGLIVSHNIEDVQHGDVVFKKDAGKHGHVGAYVGGGIIFDNSTTNIGRIVGGKGFRTVEQFDGPVQIGRYKAAK